MSGAAGRLSGGLPPAPEHRWKLAEAPDAERVGLLERELKLPRPLCRVLAARGWQDPDGAKRFLRPLLEHLHPPDTLADGVRAAERVARAIRSGETILVHGDYDVDGVCGAALLTRRLRELGGSVEAFVPHRLRDGYDLGDAGLERARSVGASLLVTVDCGTVALDAVERARKGGLDVVVTDHHTPGPELPPALAVVNPSRSDCSYPGGELCGTAVAFQLLRLVGERMGRPFEELHPHLDLVALATVADLVPLRGENRTLVRLGLRVLPGTANAGLRALMEVTGLAGGPVTAGQIGFVLAPRINALGRMADAGEALRLLLTDDPVEARALAERSDRENRGRRDEDRRTLDAALELLARSYDPARDFGVVVAGEGWHPGVIGIVASRVVERLHRPAVLVALDGERGRGSARSIPGFHLYDALRECSGHLERFGGHEKAAGMELRRDRLDDFRESFAGCARARLADADLRPLLAADAEIPLTEVTEELHRLLRYVGPFGMGNPRPVFVSRGVGMDGPARVVGRGHLKLRLRQDGVRLEGIGFDLAERRSPESLGEGPLDVAYQVTENEYRGRRTLQARLLDVRPS